MDQTWGETGQDITLPPIVSSAKSRHYFIGMVIYKKYMYMYIRIHLQLWLHHDVRLMLLPPTASTIHHPPPTTYHLPFTIYPVLAASPASEVGCGHQQWDPRSARSSHLDCRRGREGEGGSKWEKERERLRERERCSVMDSDLSFLRILQTIIALTSTVVQQKSKQLLLSYRRYSFTCTCTCT